MISIQQALEHVLKAAERLAAEVVPLEQACGYHVAVDISSDIDSPPYNKALMDGFAIRSADITGDNNTLTVIEEVTAGRVPQLAVAEGCATRIMTGSPIPAGADAVVMLEATTSSTRGGATRVTLDHHPVASGQNILPRGTCLRSGEVVMTAGTRISTSGVALLAEIGCADVPVVRPARVAIVTTGNEVVAAQTKPGPGQIRNSNGPMLTALAGGDGAQPHNLGVARDSEVELRQKFEEGLGHDILLISGGVSAGDLDLVPATLSALGVDEIFHRVRVKPGQPVWFGKKDSTLVFGLPGNPVSSFVCYTLFARPAIRQRQGAEPGTDRRWGRITKPTPPTGTRPVYFPAKFTESPADLPQIEPLAWKGSADIRTLSAANCLIELPAESALKAQDTVQFLPID